MMTMNLHLKTFQFPNQQQLLPSSICLGDTVGFVFASRRVSQTTLQNSPVHFANEEVGKEVAIKGVLDDVRFYLFAMKEPDYMMQIMSMYGTLGNLGEEKTQHFTITGVHQVVQFFYTKVAHNHYAYRDVIDNDNSQCMHPISMEETWMTACWQNRVFCFLLVVTMVNIPNAGVYFYL